jgi:hypothetical protein
MKLRVTVALFAFLAFITSLSQAQMSEGERKAAARAAYAEGVELQDKGKPTEALSRFEAAQKLYDAPTHLLRIAECQTVTGKLVEASETYETLSRKTLPAGSPEAFVQAQERGKTALIELRKRIPTLRVAVKPEPQNLQNLQIVVNDKQMPNELVGIARPVNPGPYKLTAYATGYGTPSPSSLEIGESEQKNVELTLQQGVTGAPVVVGPTTSTTAPPPYEQPKTTKPAEGPSATGVLFGVRGGVLVPTGDVDKTTKFGDYAAAGGGIGADVMGRFGKIFLLGASVEFASFGGPSPNALPAGTSAQISTSSTYYGILAGIIPNVDKFTFVADAGVGVRSLDQSRTVTTLGVVGPRKSDESYSGFEIALNAGVSFPVGPVRIVPKAGFAFGQFTDRSCSGAGAAVNRPGCETVNASSHTMFNVLLAVYYHLDLSKKPPPPPAAAATIPSLAASRTLGP